MTYDGEDDLFDEEFDFVDEDEDDLEDSDAESGNTESGDTAAGEEPAEVEEDSAPKKRSRGAKSKTRTARSNKPKLKAGESDEAAATESSQQDSGAEASTLEESGTEPAEAPGPPTDHVVHLYEFGDFTRTIAREFTSEDAEAFAVEYNRTSTAHSRLAVAAGKDEEAALSVST